MNLLCKCIYIKKKLIVLSFVLSYSCYNQNLSEYNFDFEEAPNNFNKLSKGWKYWGNYDFETDTISHSGKFAAKITSDSLGGTSGAIYYMIPKRYSGKTIQLSGYMKTKDVSDGFAGLLLSIEGESSVFDNMESRNISGTKDWEIYSITLDYPRGAEEIYLGGILTGTGEVWFDDFQLSIDGKVIQTLKPIKKQTYLANKDDEFDSGSNIKLSTKLGKNEIQNLAALCNVWGFLKYYHPEIGKGNYNWDYELFRFIPKIINVKDKYQFNQLIIDWIHELGVLKICKECKDTSSEAILQPDFSWMQNNSILNISLKNELLKIYNNRHQGLHYYVQSKKYTRNPIFNENSYYRMSYPDEGFRLLTLFRYWNIIKYFFPYRHLIEKNWDNVLLNYIPQFINSKNELEYELVVLRLIAEIGDSHANIQDGGEKIDSLKGRFYSPLHTRFINESLVVVDYYNPELKSKVGLEIGDVITKIGSKKIQRIVDSISKFYPASNKAARLRDISQDILRSHKKEIRIEYTRNSDKFIKNIPLYSKNNLNIYKWYPNTGGKSYKFLKDSIGYITLASIKMEDIDIIKEKFKMAKGIIIDIRNYPSTFVAFALGSYFVQSSTPFVKFSSMNLNNPGEFKLTKNLEIPKGDYTFTGKVVVLVNEYTQSQAEYTAMALQAGKNVMVVGSSTAGADGNLSTIFLPGGIRTAISGIGVYYPDGRETQKIGIIPDIRVIPTIEGIQKRNDEVLQKAVLLLDSIR